MPWPQDVPDFPLKKPDTLEKLEQLSPQILNAMTQVEAEEKIRDAADSLAKSYYKAYKDKGNLSECSLIVSGALEQTGGSLPAKFGALMIGKSKEEGERSCKNYYPPLPFPNEIEF
jgi:hypothetical protein